MERFFFDSTEGERFVPDDVGVVLAGIDEAEREATLAAAEICRELLLKVGPTPVTISVRDESGKTLFTATACLLTQRLDDQH
ncbi:DUF6894 family protein [Terrihabitans rhizophilus]|uniref:DUF6894 family protein n=1 Tax=Terrihabitans rhizophilus TaxID=3092662 RepID=UPI003CC6010F